MTALSQNVDLAATGGEYRRLPGEINANPFQGSLLSYAADGYVHELVAGERFAGVNRTRIPTAEVPTADGSRQFDATAGVFTITVALSGAAIDDVAHRRNVYASDDATFTFTPGGNTLIGRIVGIDAAGLAIILCQTTDVAATGACTEGVVTHAATGALTITPAMFGKLNLVPSTGAQAATLPLAADVAGQSITFKKTTANAVALTLTGAGAETIDGSNTNAVIDAQFDTLTLVSDGVGFHIVAYKIA
jgi:hypothetical protein